MLLSTVLLISAGAVGAITGALHGALLHRRVIPPLLDARGRALVPAPPMRRMLIGLLHFSTFAWISGGLALIIAALFLPQAARLMAGVLVGSQFLYGAVGNFASLRRLHPGWILMSLAAAAIVWGMWLDVGF